MTDTGAQSYTAREMLAELIGFDTTSRRSNLELIDWVEAYLARHGAVSKRSYDASGKKANLFATLGPADDGSGGTSGDGGIVLSGHTDVVPVDGQDWQSDPFTLVARDGRLYGRGTSDMKGFIACALSLVPQIAARELKRPVHFALSYDEEVGCLGVRDLLADLTANGPHPALVMVGEPTEMRIVTAHKGCSGFRTRFHGKAAHSALPHHGANAVLAAGRLVGFLGDLAREKRAEQAGAELGFDPPYTSFGIGRIAGGVQLNIVPQECELLWEFRAVPGEDQQAIVERVERFLQDEVLPEFRSFHPDARIETERLAEIVPLGREEAGEMEALLRQVTGANATSVVSYATEGGLFQQAGLSAVVCGPGSIAQAHQPDEFIDPAQLDLCTEVLERLIDWAAAPERGLQLPAAK